MRFPALISLLLGAALLSGCGGGGPRKTVGNVASVTLSPSPVSINAGDVVQMSVSALDAAKQSVFNQTFTFASTNSAIQIANNGLLCGGTWDSLTTPVNCTAASVGPGGLTSMLTTTAQGVTSAPVTAYVHERIASLIVTPSNPACISQTGTVQFQPKATDASGQDVTASVGVFIWNLQPSSVGTASATTTTGAAANTVTAKLPGAAQLSISASGANNVIGVGATFEECPITSITISPAPVAFSGTGATQQMSATITDSLGATVNNQTLQWNTSSAAVASINASGLSTAVASGTAQLMASCTPNNCNIGLNQPVYSNLAAAMVPGASSTTVYATGTGTTTLVPIATSSNTAGTAITLPQTPNSFVFSPAGDKAFLGSAGGLMILDATKNTISATVTNAPGTVLAVAHDGSEVIVANGSQTFFYNVGSNTVNVLSIANAGAADFTPDLAKAFAVSGTTLFTIQPGTALTSATLPGAGTSVKVLAAGPVGYVGAGGTPFFETCSPGTVSKGPGGTPLLVASLPSGSAMIGAEAANLDVISVSINGNGTCNPSITNTLAQHAFPSNVSPREVIPTPDSMHVYVTSDLAGKLLRYDIGAGAVAPIALANGATTFTGGATPDSASVYVGGSDNTVHRIDVPSGTDAQQIPVSFMPDLVAVRP